MKRPVRYENPPHYSVIICIEYLLAIVEIVKKVIIARGFQKKRKKHAIRLCLMGGVALLKEEILQR